MVDSSAQQPALRNDVESTPRILLTGATGYVGGRLLQRLETAGLQTRCLARRPDYLRARSGPNTQVAEGDVLKGETLASAMDGIDIAYYMVHSMGSSGSFEVNDRVAAENFGAAAEKAGVKRIIYLGGLGDPDEHLSPHLRSRQEVGNILRKYKPEVIELRASIVIGSGSLSFEMIRSLVEKLPVMITPKWVHKLAQPISIEDLLDYLVACRDLPLDHSQTIEIGGADQVSYFGIMASYARNREMKLRTLPVPVLTPYLSSLWLGLITPLYARIGRELIESVVHSTIVKDKKALEVFPEIHPIGIDQAVRHALAKEDREYTATRWSDAVSSSGPLRTWKDMHYGRRLIDRRTLQVAVPADCAFAPIERIGGSTGYYAWNILWKIRAALDLLVGGVGMRRGRPDSNNLSVGDTLDFWRVQDLEPGSLLRLAAEMKIPGRAWLQFEVTGTGDSSTICQTAIFDPVGLFGRFYWYSLYPLHHLVFGGMLKGIQKEAERVFASNRQPPPPA